MSDVSKYEQRAFPMGTVQPNLAEQKNQLARLREDLDRFMARSPGAAVVTSLRGRIHELEAMIAAAEQEAVRQRQTARQVREDAAAPRDPSGTGARLTGERYPSRRKP